MGMWGAIGKGLATMGKGALTGAQMLGGVVPSLVQGKMHPWMFPIRHLGKLFNRKKDESGGQGTQGSSAQGGYTEKEPDSKPAQTTTASTEKEDAPKVSVAFDMPDSSYTPAAMPVESGQMLELNPYRMNRQRFLRGKPVNDDRG